MLTELLVEDLDEGSEAVGGAGGIADDGVGVAVVIGIHTNDVGGDVAFPGGGDEHLLRPCLNVLPCTLSVHEHSCSLDHKFDPQLPNKQNNNHLIHFISIYTL